MEFLIKLFSVRKTLATLQVDPDEASDSELFNAYALLKHLESRVKKELKKLDPIVRRRAAEGTESSNDTTSWRECSVGDITVKKYADKDGDARIKSVEDVKNLIRGKANIPMSQIIVKTEAVDVSRLVALVQTGHLTKEELDSVVDIPKKKGSFGYAVNGQKKKLLEMDNEAIRDQAARAGLIERL